MMSGFTVASGGTFNAPNASGTWARGSGSNALEPSEKAFVRVLIVGDRYWDDVDPIVERVFRLREQYGEGLVVVSGGAKGADSIAEAAAKGAGVETDIYDADWDGEGLSAGPKRNRRMLDTNPVRVIAFHNNLTRSKGTIDTIKEAVRRKIPVEIYPENEFNKRAVSKFDPNRRQRPLGRVQEENPVGVEAAGGTEPSQDAVGML